MTNIPNQKKAVIDIGTNSIKLCIAETSVNSCGYSVIYDDVIITRLGEELSEKSELRQLPSDRSLQAIQHFVTKARESNADEIRAVGTAALRKATNAALFCARVKDTCGILVEIIEGDREAQLSCSAAVLLASEEPSVIFDIGGGSIEFIYYRNNSINYKQSLDFGVLNIKEKYFLHEPVEINSVNNACLEIAGIYRDSNLLIPEASVFIGIGGTVNTMASVKLKLPIYSPNEVNGITLNIDDIESQIHKYCDSTLEERIKIPGLYADRADIILAGVCILKATMDYFSAKNVIVSAHGLRHAILSLMFR